MTPISHYDPDARRDMPSLQKRVPKSGSLAECAFLSVGKKYWGPGERKEWIKLTAPAVGSSLENAVFRKWIEHNIELVEIANRKVRTRGWTILVSMIKNDEIYLNWASLNREKIANDRGSNLQEIIATQPIKFARKNFTEEEKDY